MRLLQSIFCAWLAVGIFTDSIAQTDSKPDHRAEMPAAHRQVFEAYCFDCHSADAEEGGINLENISFNISKDIPTAELWQKILDAMNSKEMPPDGEIQVPDQAKTAFLDSLSNQMVLARSILGDSGGTITMRRLNRREYENSIESLLGVRPDVSGLPDDQSATGFDTAGASLFFSSDQLEQYLTVARDALTLALSVRSSTNPKTIHVEPEVEATPRFVQLVKEYQDEVSRAQAWKAQTDDPPSKFGFLDEYAAKRSLMNKQDWLPQLVEYLERPETKTGATMILTIKKFGMLRVRVGNLGERDGGKYVLRVRAGAYPAATERMKYLELGVRYANSSGESRLGWRKVRGTLDDPEIMEFAFEHPHGVQGQYFVHQRTHQDRGDKNLWTLDREKNGLGTLPGTWVDWTELAGPFPDEQIINAKNEIFFDQPKSWDEGRYATEVIERFATRAFRTDPPSKEYLAKLLDHFQANRKQGQAVNQALIGPLSMVLASPSFLYMIESNGEESTSALSPMELAVRLSYFLWSAPPDPELSALAKNGKLIDPTVLRVQTSRLLADERAERFIRGFVHQWLQMERLEMFEFRGALYPNFDNATRESAREEIYATIRTMLAEQIPLKSLLDSDFVVINDVLADYYEVPGFPAAENGNEFRKVSLPADSPRGGLLGTAAVLAMGSDGLRSSPVERGAWVMRHLLNDPPPPAPANVPQLSRLEGQVLPVRKLQAAHMEEPQCAQCHRKIDPIGYGLEHFNAAGGWREEEAVPTGRKRPEKLFPIDSNGTLPSGESFANYFELRDAVAGHLDDFANGFAESLIAYGLGRPFGFTDQELANQMLEQARRNDFELNEFIHALVQSKTFQSKCIAKDHETRKITK